MVDLHAIDIVSVDELHQRLGLTEALEYPADSRRRSLLDWKMEVDDAPILRYVYRMMQPRRHLEFGTWSGTGACYCLEESNATVWTLNLAEGESIDGSAAYTEAPESVPAGARPIRTERERDFYQTDAGVFIGRRYREAGFGHRVCQVYCDSRQWDTSAYPSDFFDTVLIDGGHTEDVVSSDSKMAFAVTRPGAVIMWHDFCPDPAVFGHIPSVAGVIAGVTRNWTDFAPKLRDVFWVQPSFLLFGIRGE
jgi:hypothetical protein